MGGTVRLTMMSVLQNLAAMEQIVWLDLSNIDVHNKITIEVMD